MGDPSDNERFDISRHPNELHRFGWVVEVDPHDPSSTPVKRTALGRFKHEAATCATTGDGRVVVYSGDDERLQFVYKFVSEGRFDPENPRADLDLLDRGTLYVARFDDDGTGEWLPLVPAGELKELSQAEILVNTRRSARALGATPMDRPEDVELNPANGMVYLALTKDADRTPEDPGGHANPRPANRHGHVLELEERGGDLAATRFSWRPFLLCGPAGSGEHYGAWAAADVDVLSCPDNLAFDRDGNLWVATDGQPAVQQTNDAFYAVPTAGPDRQRPRRFLTGPRGCEVCGPEFTPDGRTLFVAIQHPGEGAGIGRQQSSRWPDGGDGPPRPAVVVVRARRRRRDRRVAPTPSPLPSTAGASAAARRRARGGLRTSLRCPATRRRRADPGTRRRLLHWRELFGIVVGLRVVGVRHGGRVAGGSADCPRPRGFAFEPVRRGTGFDRRHRFETQPAGY